MKLQSLILILLLLIPGLMRAQEEPGTTSNSAEESRYTISLITCGTSDELYSAFGHTAIRVQDHLAGTDMVYNYGTFSFNEPGFYTKFTLGKLNYWLEKGYWSDFVAFYKSEDRFIKEQVLKLNPNEAKSVYHFLQENEKEENKYYKYDFIYDNCATRVRDVFLSSVDPNFEFGSVLRHQKITYRQVINQYLINSHWVRLGVNIILGSKVDSVTTDQSSMFLPDFLYEGMKGSTISGEPIITATNDVFLPTLEEKSIGLNGAFWLTFGILLITLLIFFIPALSKLKGAWSFILLIVSGLLGIFLLFMWLITEHQACDNNWNVLWAFPFNIIIAFMVGKKMEFMKIYALAAISCLIVALIVHIVGFQFLPMMELLPFFGAMMFVYMELYKNGLEASALKLPQKEQ